MASSLEISSAPTRQAAITGQPQAEAAAPRVSGVRVLLRHRCTWPFSVRVQAFRADPLGGSDPNEPQRTPRFLTILSPAWLPGRPFGPAARHQPRRAAAAG